MLKMPRIPHACVHMRRLSPPSLGGVGFVCVCVCVCMCICRTLDSTNTRCKRNHTNREVLLDYNFGHFNKQHHNFSAWLFGQKSQQRNDDITRTCDLFGNFNKHNTTCPGHSNNQYYRISLCIWPNYSPDYLVFEFQNPLQLLLQLVWRRKWICLKDFNKHDYNISYACTYPFRLLFLGDGSYGFGLTWLVLGESNSTTYLIRFVFESLDNSDNMQDHITLSPGYVPRLHE